MPRAINTAIVQFYGADVDVPQTVKIHYCVENDGLREPDHLFTQSVDKNQTMLALCQAVFNTAKTNEGIE